MKFNSNKCHVMQVSHRRNNISFDYHPGKDNLTSVSEHPYLGLTFTSKPSWKTHIISNITLKANRMLGLIKRNPRHCHPRLKEQAYFSLVHPHLEYCSSVWNPHHQSTINQIEAIQKRAARFVKKTPMTIAKLRNYHPARLKLLTSHSTKDIYRYSFMPTAVRLWNTLPVDVITSPSVDVFRAHVSVN